MADCSIGQARLIFRLTPTTLVPNPPLMVYVRVFTKIPQSACRTTGLCKVKKADGQRQYRLVPATDLVRICPLSPIILGRAQRDVNCDNMLERYTDLYLNKYRNIEDYTFMDGYGF
jgi:hypothetical protein